MNSNELLRGEARVTSNGILFNSLYYTTRLAIQQQWYHVAAKSGGWFIEIFYDPLDSGQIYLTSTQMGSSLCYIINPSTMTESKLEEYFRTMQSLKILKSTEKD